MVGLDLRGGVRISTKDDLRGGVKICVVGLKSTFNFEVVQAETIQAVDQICRRPVLYFCVAELGFLVKIGYFP